jgi:D-beta-D-heptose 7-phosphate kinase/D-beta-D-heptose 1-phosphate adenosyltransferase
MTVQTDLISLIKSFDSAKILCVGDIMLDRFVTGHVERISPEAPIPVLSVENETSMLGGAGNVVRNLSALGAHVQTIGLIGQDDAGTEIEKLLEQLKNVDANLLKDQGRQSSIKTRFLAGTQQMLRADQETVAPLTQKAKQNIIKSVTAALSSCAVLVLSDYGKGVLLDGMAKTLIEAANGADVPVIVDPKSDNYDDYFGADVITPNRLELHKASGQPVDSEDHIVKASKSLIKKYNIGAILATRSRDGMSLITDKGKATHLAAEARDVFDVSGAGDTVVAAIAAALASGAALTDAAALANVAAGIVVGKVGTAAATADEVIAALKHQSNA